LGYEEKRKAKRVPLDLKLEISSLFRQDHDLVSNVNAPIEVQNVSKSGLAFRSESVLPIGYYFNATLRLLDRKDANFYCVVKIIRKEELADGGKLYGCEFVGFPSILEYIFDELISKYED